jgi:hypothetical protein
MRTKGQLIVRVGAFGLMVTGFILSLWGQSIERNSFRALDDSERQEITTGRTEERGTARTLKNIGVCMVIAGPILWLVVSNRRQRV